MICYTGLAPDVGAAGYGRQLVQEVRELARGGAGGASGEGCALQGEVSRVDRGRTLQSGEQAFDHVVRRLPWGAVDHPHSTAGPRLDPLGLGTPVRVEDDDERPTRPPRRLQGVVYQEVAGRVEASGHPVRVEGADEVVAVQDRGHPRLLLAS